MLLLQNKIGQIGESVREFRTTLSNLSGIEPSRICKNEYDDFEIAVKIKSQKMRFIFDGIQVGAADELYGFGGHIEIFKPNGSILLWRLGMNTFIPKLQFDDLAFNDQSFFAIDDKTNDLKLFHTLDFFECTSSNDLIGTWGHGQVKKKYLKEIRPKFQTAVSHGGIIRSGVEIINISKCRFSNFLPKVAKFYKRFDPHFRKKNKMWEEDVK